MYRVDFVPVAIFVFFWVFKINKDLFLSSTLSSCTSTTIMWQWHSVLIVLFGCLFCFISVLVYLFIHSLVSLWCDSFSLLCVGLCCNCVKVKIIFKKLFLYFDVRWWGCGMFRLSYDHRYNQWRILSAYLFLNCTLYYIFYGQTLSTFICLLWKDSWNVFMECLATDRWRLRFVHNNLY